MQESFDTVGEKGADRGIEGGRSLRMDGEQ